MQNPWSLERTRIANVSLKTLLRLSKTVLLDQPDPPIPSVTPSRDLLVVQVADTEDALARRFEVDNQASAATAVALDRATDVGWIWLRKLLEGWRDFYGQAGLDALSVERQLVIGLPKLREKAEQARMLHERLFGAVGTNWTNANFIEQSETMSTILRVMNKDELLGPLVELVGPELPQTLNLLQSEYEDMVGSRMRRERDPADSLKLHRDRLRFRLSQYISAIEVVYDPEHPSTRDIVERALRAVTMLNQRIAGGVTAQELEDFEDAEFVELEFGQALESDPDNAPIEDEPAMLSL